MIVRHVLSSACFNPSQEKTFTRRGGEGLLTFLRNLLLSAFVFINLKVNSGSGRCVCACVYFAVYVCVRLKWVGWALGPGRGGGPQLHV